MILIARTAVDKTLYSFDRLFDYIVPDYLTDRVKPGVRVLVPFGSGNKKRQAMVMELIKRDTQDNRLKYVSAVPDDFVLLTPEMIKLVYAVKERCFCTYYDAVRCMLPTGINYRIACTYSLKNTACSELTEEQKSITELFSSRTKSIKQDSLFKKLGIDCESKAIVQLINMGVIEKKETVFRRVGDASVRMLRLLPFDEEDTKLTSRQKEVCTLLGSVGDVSVKEIMYYTGVTQSVIDNLISKKVCECYEQEIFRLPEVSYTGGGEDVIPTDEQAKAYNDLLDIYNRDKPAVSLLYGVTGSGKTSIFLKLIDTVYKQGRGVIVMVPEIALTPQMISIFKSRFGEDVAVFHSGLSMGERLDEWKRVRRGIAKIAVGTRSAVFAPFEDIGLIIIDEEQEYTYKSESSPRYHARDVAKLRCVEHGSLLLLSSATPSVESFYSANMGLYSMQKLTSRYGNAILPKVIISDMNTEGISASATGIGDTLLSELSENLNNGEQSILLLNRRGYNTFVTCRTCNTAVNCPNCSISLTYHADNNRLMCHYCGFSMKITDKCPGCGCADLKFSGHGTQRAEQTLAELLPGARILRLDADSTLAKQSHEKKLAAFRSGDYDILLGTQMVAKGLNFPNVTLVGVLSADQSLYNEDYRSYERAFSLFTQVVGRSGRGDKKGRAVIQTYTPENPVMKLAAAQDYDRFYDDEIKLRKAMLYPPFADICMIGLVSRREAQCKGAAKDFAAFLCGIMREKYSELPIRLMGPSPAAVYRVNNKFRYKIILKFKNSKRFREMLALAITEFSKDKKYSDVTVYVDINPDNIL